MLLSAFKLEDTTELKTPDTAFKVISLVLTEEKAAVVSEEYPEATALVLIDLTVK